MIIIPLQVLVYLRKFDFEILCLSRRSRTMSIIRALRYRTVRIATEQHKHDTAIHVGSNQQTLNSNLCAPTRLVAT